LFASSFIFILGYQTPKGTAWFFPLHHLLSSLVAVLLLVSSVQLLNSVSVLAIIYVLIILQVVESGGKNIEVAVMTKKDGLRELEEAEIDEYVAEIEAEKAAAEAAKKGAPKDT
jgi:hypothetical protein